MTKVVIDMSMSLDGFVAGPDDGKTFPLGRHGGMHIFDWYTSGPKRPGDLDILHPLFSADAPMRSPMAGAVATR
jgi:hypothetical protein